MTIATLSRHYIIDDIINNHNNPQKLIKIKTKLKKDLKLTQPDFNTKIPLATLNSSNKKKCNYYLELYRIGKTKYHIILEHFSDLNSNHYPSNPHHLTITLIPKNPEIQKLIEEIINEDN